MLILILSNNWYGLLEKQVFLILRKWIQDKQSKSDIPPTTLPVVVKKTKSPFYLYLISFEVKAEVGVKSILKREFNNEN
jgi:hypothetical protein